MRRDKVDQVSEWRLLTLFWVQRAGLFKLVIIHRWAEFSLAFRYTSESCFFDGIVPTIRYNL